jgi:uncharacterized membrane protein
MKTRWPLIAGLSLGLNLFLAAAIAGQALRQRSAFGLGGPPIVHALDAAARSLPRRDAERFATAMRFGLQRVQPQIAALDTARDRLSQDIAATTYDAAAVTRDFRLWQADWNRFIDGFGPILIDTLAGLPPEDRRHLVAARRAQTGR